MIKGLLDGVVLQMESALDKMALRNKLILSNIVNEDTPGYKPRDISFKDKLADAVDNRRTTLAVTDDRHIKLADNNHGAVEVITVEDTRAGLDGNSVSLEKEMVKMAENTMMYNASISILRRKFNIIREAIKEGR